MGFTGSIIIVVISLGAAVLIKNYFSMSKHIQAPKLDLNKYWGPGSSTLYNESKIVKPYDITVKSELIEDLKAQLQRPLKLPEPLEGAGFEYGFNSYYLENVMKYWRNEYLPNWSKREALLKKFPHFQTEIQGLNVHFVHVKPKQTAGKTVLPLLLLHGWPGSVREFYEIIPLLTEPNDQNKYVFEVIAPSLPGYAWSQGPSKQNFGCAQAAVVLHKLMLRLGHNEFLIQGGDWGSIIGANMAALFSHNIIGYHSNMCGSMGPMTILKMITAHFMPSLFYDEQYKKFFKPLPELFSHLMAETGYLHIQATKPDTIGVSLSNNPVGLAAYILEKFSTWTNSKYKHLPDGGLTKRYTLDALLDNVMIYYVTNSITTSVRLYSEQFSRSQAELQLDRVAITVPTGCVRFRNELMHSTDSQLKERFLDLVHSTYHEDGGHFAAMELPKILYEDFIEFVKKLNI
uniref:Epoxide hydrolase n=1 Tax=Glossina brevipalpis TaxID=37001 RepID=A0A1A9WPA7_9MUSC